MNTNEKLEKLAEVRDFISTYEEDKKRKLELLEMERASLIYSIMPPEIREKLEEINSEFDQKLEALESDAKLEEKKQEEIRLAGEIKDEVVREGKTVKGSVLQAVFVKGRVSWDSRGLDGLATVHPEILKLRKEGAPSVTIRKVAEDNSYKFTQGE